MEFFIVILLIWLLVITFKQRDFRRDMQRRFDWLRNDLGVLESEVRLLRRKIEALERPAPTAQQPAAEPSTPAPTPAAAEHTVVPPLPISPVPPPPQPAAPPVAASTETSFAAPLSAPPPATAEQKQVLPPRVEQLPRFATAPPAPSKPAVPAGRRLRSALDIEEALGTNWLNKVGITLLVLGVASFLIYQFGGTPAGKVTLGFIGGMTFLVGGVWLERQHRYKMFARSLIGGGWALLYFTTYAMYHVSAARVLTSQDLDLVLLLIVSYLMGAHCLHYRSQAATAIAFLLAFTTVTLSHSTVYSLVAGGALAFSLVVLTLKMGWYELELFGILASYLNHFYWLYPIIESRRALVHSGAQVPPFAEFWPSTALLIFYWVVFRASYVARRIRSATDENVSTVAALVNTVLLLGIMKYQSQHPEWTFYVLLAIGAVELLLGLLPLLRRRRIAFLMLSTIGVSLLVAAFPFRYSGMGLSVIWIAEAQVLFLAGVFSREVHFRRLGLLAALVASGQVLASGIVIGPDLRHAGVFALAALLLWMDAHLVARRWADIVNGKFEAESLRIASYIAGVLAYFAAFTAVSGRWFPLVLAALAVTLAALARRFKITEFVYEAAVFAPIAALFSASEFIFKAAPLWHGVQLRLFTGSLIALMLYLCARWSAIAGSRAEPVLRSIYTWYAAGMLTLVAWRALPPMWVAVAWLVMAALLAVAGRKIPLANLTLQANLLAIGALARLAYVNLGSTELYTHITIRLVTVACAVALYYLLSHWASIQGWESTRVLRHFHSWIGSVLLALLAWYELQPIAVVPAWTVLGVVLFELGLARSSANQRFQGYVGLVAAFVRIFIVNLNAVAAPGELSPRVYTVLPLALALYYVYVRLESAGRERLPLDLNSRVPHIHTWLGTITLAALVRFELAPDWVAAGWAGLVVALVAVATIVHRRTFLDQSLLLGVAVLVRAGLFNLAERSNLPTHEGNLLTVGTAVGLLLLALPFAFYMRKEPAAGNQLLRLLDAHPEQVFFFVPVALLTATLAFEMSKGLLTIAFGVEGVAVFVLALFAHQRSYRLTGLGLLLLCVLKIVCVDVWGLDAQHRYLTLIILGAALLVVSFLYNRHREALRQLL